MFQKFEFKNKECAKFKLFPFTTVFWVHMQTLINLKRKIYLIKVFIFKYNLKLNAAFSAE